jgi:hypothetical protein
LEKTLKVNSPDALDLDEWENAENALLDFFTCKPLKPQTIKRKRMKALQLITTNERKDLVEEVRKGKSPAELLNQLVSKYNRHPKNGYKKRPAPFKPATARR